MRSSRTMCLDMSSCRDMYQYIILFHTKPLIMFKQTQSIQVTDDPHYWDTVIALQLTG